MEANKTDQYPSPLSTQKTNNQPKQPNNRGVIDQPDFKSTKIPGDS